MLVQLGGNGIGDGLAAQQTTVRNQDIVQLPGEPGPFDKYLNEFEDATQGAAKTDPRYAFSVYQTENQFNNNPSVQELAKTLRMTKTMLHQMFMALFKKVSWRKVPASV